MRGNICRSATTVILLAERKKSSSGRPTLPSFAPSRWSFRPRRSTSRRCPSRLTCIRLCSTPSSANCAKRSPPIGSRRYSAGWRRCLPTLPVPRKRKHDARPPLAAAVPRGWVSRAGAGSHETAGPGGFFDRYFHHSRRGELTNGQDQEKGP